MGVGAEGEVVVSRTGLAAAVPTLELCREMAAVPALAEAFKESALVWDVEVPFIVRRECQLIQAGRLPAPLVGEMLAWLKTRGATINQHFALWLPGVDFPMVDATSPDALARACVEAARRDS